MHWRRRFGYEFAASLGFYAVLLVLSISLQVHMEPAGMTRYVLSVLPMLGCIATLVAVMRAVRHMDELERRIQFEGVTFAFVLTAMVTFGWGFLELAGAPRLPAFFVWPIMGAGWMVGTLAATRRYR
jgi:hypothetical protein